MRNTRHIEEGANNGSLQFKISVHHREKSKALNILEVTKQVAILFFRTLMTLLLTIGLLPMYSKYF
jgi:hypothetical protein